MDLIVSDILEKKEEGTTILGNPKIIDSPYGKAVEFNGVDDAIFLDSNPVKGLSQFTVEVLMRPDANGLTEQRFFHLGFSDSDRLLLETRLTEDNKWYLDTFIATGDSSQPLIDPAKTHPTGKWFSVALVVDNGKMSNYINGVLELEGKMNLIPFNAGTTSIGVRQNKICWYKGAFYKFRITPELLTPDKFLKV